MIKGKIKKALLITAVTLVVAIVVIIACISPITKYLIEKNSVKLLGRKVKMGWLYLNPFTVYHYAMRFDLISALQNTR